MIYQLSAISYQRSAIRSQQAAVSYLSFPRKWESSSLTSSLSGLTGQSRTKVLDSPIKSGNDRKKLRRNDNNFTVFNSSEAGFTLIEILIAMVVFVLAIAAASQIFTGLLTQFKQQSKIAETNIEGIIGLEILRQDIGHAGYGLPWNVDTDGDEDGNDWSSLSNYKEAASVNCEPDPADFNDAGGSGGEGSPPRAIFSGNNVSFSGCGANSVFNGSDYLVIKASNVATSGTAQKWTTLKSASPYKRTWTPSGENLINSDMVVVVSPGSTKSTTQRSLITNEKVFSTTFGNVTSSPWPPAEVTETRIVYGVDPDTALGMPFNRADYYIWRYSTNPATDEVPDRCAPNTGILRKAVISQDNGTRTQVLSLLDCVADMQVIYGLDSDGDEDTPLVYDDDISDLTAQEIRNQVKEVRIYILAHEGQGDPNYTYPTNPVPIPAATDPGAGLGRPAPGFNLSGITNWQNYRWKIYTLVVKPNL